MEFVIRTLSIDLSINNLASNMINLINLLTSYLYFLGLPLCEIAYFTLLLLISVSLMFYTFYLLFDIQTGVYITVNPTISRSLSFQNLSWCCYLKAKAHRLKDQGPD